MDMIDNNLLLMYRQMVVIRLFEETAQRYYEQGHIWGAIHLSIGEEAVAVGACSALEDGDYLISTHRAHGHLLARGASMRVIMAELFGKATGCTRGMGGSMHLSDFDRNVLGTNGIVGGGIPIAGGVGLAIKMSGTDQVCLGFLGDGASNEGEFHETLNLASCWQVPTVFVCSNNQYAVSMPSSTACANTDISARASAYAMPGYRVDGTDVLAVYESVKSAVSAARRGEGPSLVECVAYRWRGHSRGDKAAYRPQSEVVKWMKKDPIELFKRKLADMGYITDEVANEIETAAKAEISEAVSFAMESPEPSAEEIFNHIYAEEQQND